MNRPLAKLTGTILAATVALLGVACSQTQNPAPEAPAPAAAPATSAPTPTPAPAPAPAPTPAAPAAAAPAAADADLLEEGKVIFMERAGGMGCMTCHGPDARGDSAIGGPDIRGRPEADVRQALTDVEMMRVISLTDAEIKAVVAYLKYLGEQ